MFLLKQSFLKVYKSFEGDQCVIICSRQLENRATEK